MTRYLVTFIIFLPFGEYVKEEACWNGVSKSVFVYFAL